MDPPPDLATGSGPARRSPPTKRVVQILDLLADDADRPWHIRAIARELGITPSTALAVLNELREAGYVVRSEEKTYALGPALIAVGLAADARYPAVHLAADELAPLVAKSGYGASVAFKDGNELVLAHRFGNKQYFLTRDDNARVPFTFPYGALFLAYMPERRIDDWAASAGLNRDQKRQLTRDIEQLRRDGFQISGSGAVSFQVLETIRTNLLPDVDPNRSPILREVERLLAGTTFTGWFLNGLDPSEDHQVGLLTAIVFDEAAYPRLMLSLQLAGEKLAGRDVLALAHELRREADRITDLLGGRTPYPTRGDA